MVIAFIGLFVLAYFVLKKKGKKIKIAIYKTELVYLASIDNVDLHTTCRKILHYCRSYCRSSLSVVVAVRCCRSSFVVVVRRCLSSFVVVVCRCRSSSSMLLLLFTFAILGKQVKQSLEERKSQSMKKRQKQCIDTEQYLLSVPCGEIERLSIVIDEA